METDRKTDAALTLGELEASTSAFTTRFLSLFFSGVTGHETALAHRGAHFGIKTDKRSGDPELDRAGLSRAPAALDEGEADNPLAAHVTAETARLTAGGETLAAARNYFGGVRPAARQYNGPIRLLAPRLACV